MTSYLGPLEGTEIKVMLLEASHYTDFFFMHNTLFQGTTQIPAHGGDQTETIAPARAIPAISCLTNVSFSPMCHAVDEIAHDI